MAVISFIAGGMLAFVAAVSSWLFVGASATTALNVYLIIGFGIPFCVIAFATVRNMVVATADRDEDRVTARG